MSLQDKVGSISLSRFRCWGVRSLLSLRFFLCGDNRDSCGGWWGYAHILEDVLQDEDLVGGAHRLLLQNPLGAVQVGQMGLDQG